MCIKIIFFIITITIGMSLRGKSIYNIFNNKTYVDELENLDIIEYGNGIVGKIYLRGKHMLSRNTKWSTRYFLLRRYDIQLWKLGIYNKKDDNYKKRKLKLYSCKRCNISGIKSDKNNIYSFTYKNRTVNIELGSKNFNTIKYLHEKMIKYKQEYDNLSLDFKRNMVLSPFNNRSQSLPQLDLSVSKTGLVESNDDLGLRSASVSSLI
tara:strand:+ start:2590 stop:3213 length:624 start_codon:yes stop_codon:yes gene_type:complete